MGLKHAAALVAFAGVALIVTGAIVLFGAWAMIAAGVVVVAVALLPDWEKVL